MFNSLNLYYLNQIGITPWIKKSNPLKLMVLLSSNLSDKEMRLLRNILTFLKLSAQEYKMITIENPTDMQSLTTKNSPIIVLSIGLGQLNLTQPYYKTPELKYLLENPIEKKQMYLYLTTLKAAISSS